MWGGASTTIRVVEDLSLEEAPVGVGPAARQAWHRLLRAYAEVAPASPVGASTKARALSGLGL